MDKEQRKRLVSQLSQNIEHSRALTRINDEVTTGWIQYPLEDVYCEKYITKEKSADLVSLYEMLKIHEEIDNVELKKMLAMHPIAFNFLRKINKLFKDMVQELREHGPKWIVVTYCGKKRFKEASRFSWLD